MESFIVLFDSSEYSAMYRVTVADDRVRYQLIPGTLSRKAAVVKTADSKPELP